MTSTNTRARKRAPARRSTDNKSLVPAKGGRPGKYEWEPVRIAYIEGTGDDDQKHWPTLNELSDQFDIPAVRIREKSAAERWVNQREKFQMDMEQTRRRARIKELASRGTQFDADSLSVAEAGMQITRVRLGEIIRDIGKQNELRELQSERLQAGMDADPLALTSVIDAQELRDLASAAMGWQKLGQSALGQDAIEVHHTGEVKQAVSITQELIRDDPERLAQFVKGLERSGIIQIGEIIDIDSEDIDDANIVEENEEGGQ